MPITTPTFYPEPWAANETLVPLTPAEMAAGYPSGDDQKPSRQSINNALQYAVNGVLYYLTTGIPAWSATATYQMGAIVTRAGRYYASLINGSIDQPPPNSAWMELLWLQSALDARYALLNGSVAFAACEVDKSPVRTFANSPEGGQPGGMQWPPAGVAVSTGFSWSDESLDPVTVATWPPAGIPVSTGTAWDTSIDPTTVAHLSAINDGLIKAQSNVDDDLDVSASHVSIGTDTTAPGVPLVLLVNASEPADQKAWTLSAQPGFMAFGVKDDAGQDWQWMQVFRAGFGVTGITMHTPFTVSANLNGSFITSAVAGIQFGQNLLFGGNEADIINCYGAGGGGGFAFYNIVGGETLTPASLPAFRSDRYGAFYINGPLLQLSGGTTPPKCTANIYADTVVSFDAAGPDAATMGVLQFRLEMASGTGLMTALHLDSVSGATFNGKIQVGVSSGAAATLPAMTSDGTNIFVNANPNGSVFLNWDRGGNSGTAGVNFCNGSEVITGHVDGLTGNATFNGNVNAVLNLIAGAVGLTNKVVIHDTSSVATLDSYGADASTHGAFSFNSKLVDGSQSLESLHIDGAGNAVFLGSVTSKAAFSFSSGSFANPNAAANTTTQLLLYGGLVGTGNFIGWAGDGDALIVFQKSGATGTGGLSIGAWGGNAGIRIDATANAVSLMGIVGCTNQFSAGGMVMHTPGGSCFIDIHNPYMYFQFTAAGGICQCINGSFASTAQLTVVPNPLDEATDLWHSSLEGPENAVFYRGEVVLVDGAADVTLPDYFEPLTFAEDRSVLLTQIDDDKPLAMLAASRIMGGKFHIRSSVPDATVAWEVKAVRRIGVDKLEVVKSKPAQPKLAQYKEN